MISFIVPAHNEEDSIGRCLSAIQEAAEPLGEAYEIIVADDASTDRTAAIAEEHGARVIRVRNRQIAATRNAGARAANGDVFFFVDADTLANEAALFAAREALRKGAVGGGCVFDFDGPLPLWARVLLPGAIALMRLLNATGGGFLFCTREAFEAAGGFCERYYAIEDRPFIDALKRRGRFVLLRPRVITSGRKVREISFWQAMRLVARVAFGGPEAFTRREGSELWYGPRGDGPPS